MPPITNSTGAAIKEHERAVRQLQGYLSLRRSLDVAKGRAFSEEVSRLETSFPCSVWPDGHFKGKTRAEVLHPRFKPRPYPLAPAAHPASAALEIACGNAWQEVRANVPTVRLKRPPASRSWASRLGRVFTRSSGKDQRLHKLEREHAKLQAMAEKLPSDADAELLASQPAYARFCELARDSLQKMSAAELTRLGVVATPKSMSPTHTRGTHAIRRSFVDLLRPSEAECRPKHASVPDLAHAPGTLQTAPTRALGAPFESPREPTHPPTLPPAVHLERAATIHVCASSRGGLAKREPHTPEHLFSSGLSALSTPALVYTGSTVYSSACVTDEEEFTGPERVSLPVRIKDDLDALRFDGSQAIAGLPTPHPQHIPPPRPWSRPLSSASDGVASVYESAWSSVPESVIASAATSASFRASLQSISSSAASLTPFGSQLSASTTGVSHARPGSTVMLTAHLRACTCAGPCTCKP